MKNNMMLNKLAKLAVIVGVNVQKGQLVFVRSSTENRELAREIVKQAYIAGASKVVVDWTDDYVAKYSYTYETVESLQIIPDYEIDKYKDYVTKKGCTIYIFSPVPDLNSEIDPRKLQAKDLANRKALSFYYENNMSLNSQWCIISAPNRIWAEKVFPKLKGEQAIEKLWDAILSTSRITMDNDPINEWKQHNEQLLKHNEILNHYNFDKLHFKNNLGTDIIVKLVDHHIWSGGGDLSSEGVLFNPNIPTEENFTMPHKYGVNGKVVATKPLNYQGKLIEDFWLEFKDGKVVDYDAKKNIEVLDNLINFDEGSSYLGEIALVSYDSPISKSGILFYNTLFDENASCHMALGNALLFNMIDGAKYTLKELQERGYNNSLTHVDFMFGSKDMSITGETKTGKEIVIFKDGNFVI